MLSANSPFPKTSAGGNRSFEQKTHVYSRYPVRKPLMEGSFVKIRLRMSIRHRSNYDWMLFLTSPMNGLCPSSYLLGKRSHP